MNETRVNLRHLLEDLRDGYALPVEEVIITELIANSLDSRASSVSFFARPHDRSLICVDNGNGMKRNELRNYHDIASTTKEKGQGIGFAGVGAKLSLLVAESVVTETKGPRRARCATTWRLVSDTRAPWKFIPFSGLIQSPRGTAVLITLADSGSRLLDPLFIEKTIAKHFYPLLHHHFMEAILKHVYKKGVNFFVNGSPVALPQQELSFPAGTFKVFLGGKRGSPAGFGYLVKSESDLAEGLFGMAISTYGKVVKRGWEWIGVTPKHPRRMYGVVEIPGLSQILTTNKTDFLNDAASLKKYYRFRKAVQETIIPMLEEFGESEIPSQAPPEKRLRPLEREIEYVLRNLIGDFPELTSLVAFRRGKTVTVGIIPDENAPPIGVAIEGSGTMGGTEGGHGEGLGEGQGLEIITGDSPEPHIEPSEKPSESGREHQGRRKSPGVTIRFEENSEDENLGRMVESTIWINTAHPAYRKATEEGYEGYHIVTAVALVLSVFVESGKSPQDFINRFFSAWGRGEEGTMQLFKA